MAIKINHLNELREAFGQFATGVCVVTTCPPGTEPLGVTINSFTSVSLDPPLLLWNLKIDSEVYQAFELADAFTVNVLTNEQQDVSDRYANKTKHRLIDESYTMGKSSTPVLKTSLSWFECTVSKRIEAGDHLIFIGEVVDFKKYSGEPLLFYGSRYHELRE